MSSETELSDLPFLLLLLVPSRRSGSRCRLVVRVRIPLNIVAAKGDEHGKDRDEVYLRR